MLIVAVKAADSVLLDELISKQKSIKTLGEMFKTRRAGRRDSGRWPRGPDFDLDRLSLTTIATDSCRAYPMGPAAAAAEFEQIRNLAYRSFATNRTGSSGIARLGRLLRAGGRQLPRALPQHRGGRDRRIAHRDDRRIGDQSCYVSARTGAFRFSPAADSAELAGVTRSDLSAACATGEEVWSLAMLLHEAAPSRRSCVGQRHPEQGAEFWRSLSKTAARAFRHAGWPVLFGRSRRVLGGAAADLGPFQRINLMHAFSWPRCPRDLLPERDDLLDRVTREKLVRKLPSA